MAHIHCLVARSEINFVSGLSGPATTNSVCILSTPFLFPSAVFPFIPGQHFPFDKKEFLCALSLLVVDQLTNIMHPHLLSIEHVLTLANIMYRLVFGCWRSSIIDLSNYSNIKTKVHTAGKRQNSTTPKINRKINMHIE